MELFGHFSWKFGEAIEKMIIFYKKLGKGIEKLEKCSENWVKQEKR